MKILLKYIIPILIISTGILLQVLEIINFSISDFLTFLLVFLTYFYVFFTWETLSKIKQESYLERRPYFVADFKSDKSELIFYLKNIGKTPAKNVKVVITPDIIKFDGATLNNSIFDEQIDFFPPEKVVDTLINATFEYFDKNPDRYKVSITYMDMFDKKLTDEISLDIQHHKKQTYIVRKDIHDLVESVEKLNKTISKINAI